MGCQLTWVNKLQTQAALSTLESKYISLSCSMIDLIIIRGLIQENSDVVLMGKLEKPNIKIL